MTDSQRRNLADEIASVVADKVPAAEEPVVEVPRDIFEQYLPEKVGDPLQFDVKYKTFY